MRSLYANLAPGLAVFVSAFHLQAQDLATPQMPVANQPKPPPSVTGPSLDQQATSSYAVPDNLSQRAGSDAPIQSVGPATQVKPMNQQQAIGQTLRYGTPVDVMDARGMTISGAIQVAPNRIYVPSTGKYHNTLSVGEQQRIVP